MFVNIALQYRTHTLCACAQAPRHGQNPKITSRRAFRDFRQFSFSKIILFFSNPATMRFYSNTSPNRLQHGNSHKNVRSILTHCTYMLSQPKIPLKSAVHPMYFDYYTVVPRKMQGSVFTHFRLFVKKITLPFRQPSAAPAASTPARPAAPILPDKPPTGHRQRGRCRWCRCR